MGKPAGTIDWDLSPQINTLKDIEASLVQQNDILVELVEATERIADILEKRSR